MLMIMGALSFGSLLDWFRNIDKTLSPLSCVVYPIIMGSIKLVHTRVVDKFEMEDIFEFNSLALAAFPYRFVFFGIDRIPEMFILLGVKTSYKIYINFGRLFLLPYKSRLVSEIKRRLSKQSDNKVEQEPKQERNSPVEEASKTIE